MRHIMEVDDELTEVEFYDTEDGKCPVQDFLDSLSQKMLAKTLRTIDLLESFGTSLRGPFSKALHEGIYELRTIQSSNIIRVFYFFFDGNKAVLTNGFIKKSSRTPYSELNLALKYKADYERRH